MATPHQVFGLVEGAFDDIAAFAGERVESCWPTTRTTAQLPAGELIHPLWDDCTDACAAKNGSVGSLWSTPRVGERSIGTATRWTTDEPGHGDRAQRRWHHRPIPACPVLNGTAGPRPLPSVARCAFVVNPPRDRADRVIGRLPTRLS
ncbi:hypothetical protein [Nocardia sp. NBC_00511]|uniref:hypothetical protein n=1 Tax=Nocardia sp. NBC_00511 TaxID=2903591 RepID=UPI0030E0A5AA